MAKLLLFAYTDKHHIHLLCFFKICRKLSSCLSLGSLAVGDRAQKMPYGRIVSVDTVKTGCLNKY